MKKNIFILTIILLFPILLSAQDTYQLKLKDVAFTTVNLKFYADSVIDNRFLKTAYGIAQKGLGNRPTPIVLPNGIGDIKNYLDKNLPERKKDFIPIIVVINQLWLSEKTKALSETGRADLEIDFCIKDSLGKLWTVHEFIGVLEEKGGADVTSGHERRLRRLLFDAFIELNKLDFDKLEPQLFEIKKIDSTQNILTAKKLNKGFYKSFEEFYGNAPSTQKENLSIVPINEKPNRNQYKIVDNTKNSRIKNYYGYCDGQNIFINGIVYGQMATNYYSKVVSFGRYMLLDDTFADPKAEAALGIGFGLIGGLIAQGMRIKGMVIDMKTGQPIVFTEKGFEQILGKYSKFLNPYMIEKSTEYETKAKIIQSINSIETK